VKWQIWAGMSAGGHMPDQHAGGQLGDRRRIPRHGPGEDLHLGAPLGQPLGHLNDVDVEAPCVAGARLIEG
jgi:hypothetical protein